MKFALVCWPRNQRPDSDLLRELAWYFPGHRHTRALLQSAGYLNRDIGTFHETWVIGTKPLVVAFLDERPDLTRYRTAVETGATSPGIERILTRRGQEVLVDRRFRDAKLVSKVDLPAEANVVLVFPDEMEILQDGQISCATPQRPLIAKMFILRLRRSPPELMLAIVERNGLSEIAEASIEVPVSR